MKPDLNLSHLRVKDIRRAVRELKKFAVPDKHLTAKFIKDLDRVRSENFERRKLAE